MADNIISQYYTKNDGSQIGNDAQLINGVYQNEKIINKNSGEKFVKSSNYRNVFDKVDEKISKIDDANANGVCSCKNTSGVEVDTFKCHVPVSNSAPTLNWGQTSTIGTVDGKPLTVKLPPNPNTDTDTKYSAGTGLTLSGTEFSISEEYFNNVLRYYGNDNYYRYKVEYKEKGENIPPSAGGSGMTYPISGWYIMGYSAQGHHTSYELISISQELLDKINNSGGSSEPWSTFYFSGDITIDVGDVVPGSKLYRNRNLTENVESGSWRLMLKDVESFIGSGANAIVTTYKGKFEKVG